MKEQTVALRKSDCSKLQAADQVSKQWAADGGMAEGCRYVQLARKEGSSDGFERTR